MFRLSVYHPPFLLFMTSVRPSRWMDLDAPLIPVAFTCHQFCCLPTRMLNDLCCLSFLLLFSHNCSLFWKSTMKHVIFLLLFALDELTLYVLVSGQRIYNINFHAFYFSFSFWYVPVKQLFHGWSKSWPLLLRNLAL